MGHVGRAADVSRIIRSRESGSWAPANAADQAGEVPARACPVLPGTPTATHRRRTPESPGRAPPVPHGALAPIAADSGRTRRQPNKAIDSLKLGAETWPGRRGGVIWLVKVPLIALDSKSCKISSKVLRGRLVGLIRGAPITAVTGPYKNLFADGHHQNLIV